MASKLCFLFGVLATAVSPSLAADSNGWLIENYSSKKQYPEVSYNFLSIKGNVYVFSDMKLECSSGSLRLKFTLVFQGGKYDHLVVTHAGTKKEFFHSERSYYSILDEDANTLADFLAQGSKSGDYKYEFEAVNPEDSKYATKTQADMRGLKLQKEFNRKIVI